MPVSQYNQQLNVNEEGKLSIGGEEGQGPSEAARAASRALSNKNQPDLTVVPERNTATAPE